MPRVPLLARQSLVLGQQFIDPLERIVGRRQVSSSQGRQGGAGLALAGFIVGLVLVALCVVFWLWLVVAGDCERTNGGFRCST